MSGTRTPCSFHSAVIPHFTAMAPGRSFLGCDPGFAMPMSSNIQSLSSACSLMLPGLAMGDDDDVAMDRLAAHGIAPAPEPGVRLRSSGWCVAPTTADDDLTPSHRVSAPWEADAAVGVDASARRSASPPDLPIARNMASGASHEWPTTRMV